MDTQMLIGSAFQKGTEADEKIFNPKTGETLKTLKLGQRTLLGPIAMGDTVYVATDEADLIAIR